MNRNLFPLLTGAIGLILAVILMAGGALGGSDAHSLPLLTMLFISEFGFLVCTAGFGFGISYWKAQREKHHLLFISLACVLLAGLFAFTGISLWSDSVAAVTS